MSPIIFLHSLSRPYPFYLVSDKYSFIGSVLGSLVSMREEIIGPKGVGRKTTTELPKNLGLAS